MADKVERDGDGEGSDDRVEDPLLEPVAGDGGVLPGSENVEGAAAKGAERAELLGVGGGRPKKNDTQGTGNREQGRVEGKFTWFR